MQISDGSRVPAAASLRNAPAEAVRAALDNFKALLADADFTAELEMLGIGRLQLLRRRQMKIELTGLFMALWRLALARSFPLDAAQMFVDFQAEYAKEHKDKQSGHIVTRANEYWAMLEPRGDADFSEVARHLSSFTAQDASKMKSANLKLVLHIRKLYKLIFDRLI